MNPTPYAELRQRINALFLDSLVTVSLIYCIAMIFDAFEPINTSIRIIAFIGVFFVYDPLFTSLFGGTIGHFLTGIRVKRGSDLEKNIIFPLALVRYLLKIIFGWISLITVTSNIESKGIHDLVVNSVVLKHVK